jgi:hypothetical protein
MREHSHRGTMRFALHTPTPYQLSTQQQQQNSSSTIVVVVGTTIVIELDSIHKHTQREARISSKLTTQL